MIRRPLPTESISPKRIDDSRVGIRGIQASSIIAKWYDTAFTPELIVEGWQRHAGLIPFGEIVPHLVHRDVVLMHDYYYTCMLPSWDVCLTLPAYMLLCEDVPGFKDRLSYVSELGDQVRTSLKILSAESGPGGARYDNLEAFLEKLHALEDELSLALSLHRSGFDVRFGERGGPDLFVNSVPCEQKSRFPLNDGTDIEVKVPDGYTIIDVYRLFILEVKKTRPAFKKAGVYFTNLSRTGAGMAYTEAVSKEKKGGRAPSRTIAKLHKEFRVIIHLALDFQKEWGKVIVPYTRYVGPDSSYTIPIPIPLAKYEEVISLERPGHQHQNGSRRI